VANITGIQVQRNKAIVGQNAFAHEAGIHQHGMLMHHSTYEIMRPEDVGISKTSLVLGKHSGRHAFRERVKELGYHLEEPLLNKIFEEFKVLCDKKKEVYDADIETLIESEMHRGPAMWTLEAFTCNAGSGTIPAAAVCLWRHDGTIVREAGVGDGPVDAVFRTIERITGIDVNLTEYQVRSVSMGEDAQGEAMVAAEHQGRTYRGRAASTDIVEASAQAFLQVINRIALRQRNGELAPLHPQHSQGIAEPAGTRS
jgi:2-isopropylmalate synthase